MTPPFSRRRFAAAAAAVTTALAGCTDDPLERPSGVVAKNLHDAEHSLTITLAVDGTQEFSETVTVPPDAAEDIDRTIPGPRFLGTSTYTVTVRLDDADPVSFEKRRDASFDHIGVTIGPELGVGIELVDAR